MRAAALFLLALLVRLAALATTRATAQFPEFWEYESIARNLLGGKGFLYVHLNTEHWAYAEPLYPFLVAAVYLATNFSVTALGLVQCVLSALLAPVAYVFGRRTFGERPGLWAGALVALHPALAGYATKFHPLTLDALLMALVALTLLILVQEPSPRHGAIFGVACAAGVLTRPTILAFVVLALAWLAWRPSGRHTLVSAVLGLGVAAVLVTPWVVRNYSVLGTVVLIRSHVGFGFWQGNHPGATGGEMDPGDPTGQRSIFETAPEDLKRRVLAADELTQDRIFWDDALRYVRQDPWAFVGRAARKLYYFWWFPPYYGTRYPDWQAAVVRGVYLVVAALAVLGLVASWREPFPGQGEGIRLAALLLVAIGLAQSAFYVHGRHRLGVEAMLLVFSGRGLSWLADRVGSAIMPSRGRFGVTG